MVKLKVVYEPISLADIHDSSGFAYYARQTGLQFPNLSGFEVIVQLMKRINFN
ncbi:MAG: hypothetical protein ACFFD2_10705 [Promethearchaeota archaeon]